MFLLVNVMKLKTKIRRALKKTYGDFDTFLEHKYEDKLTESLITGNIDEKKAWLTYNQVILELKNTLNDMLKVKELQYKLTEDVDSSINTNDACIEVIEDIKFRTEELERLYYKIKCF